MMCQVDKRKVLFAARDPFAAEKATETWQKYELLFYSMARNCFKYTSAAYLRIDILRQLHAKHVIMKYW